MPPREVYSFHYCKYSRSSGYNWNDTSCLSI